MAGSSLNSRQRSDRARFVRHVCRSWLPLMARSGPGSKQRKTLCSSSTFAPSPPDGTQSSALENGPGTLNLGEHLVGAESEEVTPESHKRERASDPDEEDGDSGGAFSHRRGLKRRRRRIMLIANGHGDTDEVEAASGEEKGGSVSSGRREGEVVGEVDVDVEEEEEEGEEEGEEVKADDRSREAHDEANAASRAAPTNTRSRRKRRSRDHHQHRRSKQQRGSHVEAGEEEGNGGDVDDGGEIDSSMSPPAENVANGGGNAAEGGGGGGCNGSSGRKDRKRGGKKRRSRVGGEGGVGGSGKRRTTTGRKKKKCAASAVAGVLTRGSISSTSDGRNSSEVTPPPPPLTRNWKPKARVVKVKICGFQRMCIKVEYRPGTFKRFFPHKVGMKAAKEMAKECVKKARELVKAGGMGQKCAICQGALKNAKTISKLEECGHQYHRKCLMQWVEKQNTCPNCRVRIQKLEGKVLENRDLRVDFGGGGFPAPQYENLLCQICNQGDRPDSFLICDMCDASGCHMECLGLLSVPEGEWFCPWCVENELQLVQSQRDPRISTFLHLEGVDLLKDLRAHGEELVRQAREQQEPASSASPPVSCQRVCWDVQPGEERLSHWMEIHEIEYAGWQWQGAEGNPLFQVWFDDDEFFDAALRDLERVMLPHRGLPVMALTAEFTDDDSSDEGSDDDDVDDDEDDDDEDGDDGLDDDDDDVITFSRNYFGGGEAGEEGEEEDDSDSDDFVLQDPESQTHGTSGEDLQDKTSGEDDEDDVDYEPPGLEQVDGEDGDSMSKDEESDSFEEWESSDSDETESKDDFDSSGSDEQSRSSDDDVDCLEMPGDWVSDSSRDDDDGEDDEDVDYEPPLDPDVVGGSSAGAGAPVPRPARGMASSSHIAAALRRIHRFHRRHGGAMRGIRSAASPDLRGRTMLHGGNVWDEGLLSDGLGLRGRNLRHGGMLSEAPSVWGFGAPFFELLWRSQRRHVRTSNWEEERRRESSTVQAAHVRTGFATKHLERNRFFHECRTTARFRGWSITTSGMKRLPYGVHAESILKQNANAHIVGRGLVFFGESLGPLGLR